MIAPSAAPSRSSVPNRILREGIITSERVARLSWPAEVFYRRLMSVVDDFGRFFGRPTLIRAACYPLQIGKVRDADITKWLTDAQRAGLVRLYEVSTTPYLELVDFRQQVRAKKSKFPDPVNGAEHAISECVAPAQQPAEPRATRMELDALPEQWRTFCQAERPHLDPQTVFFTFRDHWRANAHRPTAKKLDWAAAWRNWVRREGKRT